MLEAQTESISVLLILPNSMLVMHVYIIVKVYFRLIGTNGFYVKAGIVVRTKNYGNFTLSFDRLRQRIAPKSVQHMHQDYISSFNQSNLRFVALLLPSHTPLRKIP